MALALAHLSHAPDGPETEPPLLIAHGLFGSARNFNSLGKRFAQGRRVVMVDMRNHGASPWHEDCAYAAMAGDLAEAIERLCGGHAAVLGHSMGGKAAMVLAMTAPERVAALVVGDIAPVAYSHTHAGVLEAMRAVDLSAVRRRSDAEPQLAGAIPEPGLRAFVLQNLVIDGGAARWRVNLAALAAGMGALTGFPDDLGAPYPGPALFLSGGASDYVSEAHRPQIAARFPSAEHAVIEGAGHWLHAEAPEAVFAAVAGWLSRHAPGNSTVL